MKTESTPAWGLILIVGGSGRLGYFLAQTLLQQPECGRIISLSRGPAIAHPCEGVEYRFVDVEDYQALASIMRDLRPETIIYAAAPPHTNLETPKSEYEAVFVHAQDILITLAREVGTKYIVGTTSSGVVAGYQHVEVNETAPLWPEDSSAWAYWVQRARAERRLLAADCPSSGLQTVSLRLPLIIGERETAFVAGMMQTMRAGQTGLQLGNDKGALATVSGGDAARAHLLALLALRKPQNEVHGEAFFIVGPTPLSFWTMARIMWDDAGCKNLNPPFVVPECLAKLIALLSESILPRFGVKPRLSMHVLRFMCNQWTYDGSKARDRLGYTPQDDTEKQLRASVRWFLEQEKSVE